MSISLPSLSKDSKPDEIQDFLNAVALDLRQKSLMEMKKTSDQKGDVLAATTTITNDLIASLFRQIPTEALEQIGKYLISHPEALVVATTAAAGAPPHPVSVSVLGLMILVMSSTTSSSLAATASENLENFMEANLKDEFEN